MWRWRHLQVAVLRAECVQRQAWSVSVVGVDGELSVFVQDQRKKNEHRERKAFTTSGKKGGNMAFIYYLKYTPMVQVSRNTTRSRKRVEKSTMGQR